MLNRADRLTRHELALEAGGATAHGGRMVPAACLCGPGDGPCEAEGCGWWPVAAHPSRAGVRGEDGPSHVQAGGRGATSCDGSTRARAAADGNARGIRVPAEQGGEADVGEDHFARAPLELLVDDFDRWAVRPLVGFGALRGGPTRARGRS